VSRALLDCRACCRVTDHVGSRGVRAAAIRNAVRGDDAGAWPCGIGCDSDPYTEDFVARWDWVPRGGVHGDRQANEVARYLQQDAENARS